VVDGSLHTELVHSTISTPGAARCTLVAEYKANEFPMLKVSRVLILTGSSPLQVFSPYGSQYTLPIPASATPKATITARTVNYTEASMGGIMDLAKATTNFALRFTGTCIPCPPERLYMCLVPTGHDPMITTP